VFFCLYLSISIVLFCFISYFAIILDGVHLSRRATSAPDTNSASFLLLIFFVVVTLCVNKDVYIFLEQIDQINRIGIVEGYFVFKTSGSVEERTKTSTEMRTGCQQNVYWLATNHMSVRGLCS